LFLRLAEHCQPFLKPLEPASDPYLENILLKKNPKENKCHCVRDNHSSNILFTAFQLKDKKKTKKEKGEVIDVCLSYSWIKDASPERWRHLD